MSQLQSSTYRPSFRTNRRLSLGLKLPMSIIGILFIALVVLSFLSIRLSQQALADRVQQELQNQVTAKVESIQSDLLIAQTVALDLATVAEINNLEEEYLIQSIRAALKRNEIIFGSTIAFEPEKYKQNTIYYAPYFNRLQNNTLVFTDRGTPEYDYFRKDWYTQPKLTQKPFVSAPYFDYGGGNIWMITLSAPFYDDAGGFAGVATADLAFLQTQEVMSSIQVGKDGYAFMIDSAGIILGAGTNAGSYKTMSDSMVLAAFSENTSGWIQLVSDMRAGKSGFVEASDPRGEPMLVAFAPVGLDTGWSIALAYPKAELALSTNQLRNTLIGYSAIVIFITSVLILALSRSITDPLATLRKFAEQVSGETLTGGEESLLQKLQIQTQDELEDLGNAFNQMSESLRTSFVTLEERVTSRTKDIEHLANELRTIAEVTRELSSIRDQNTLLNVSATLIRERLGYYHVGIFLIDERGEFAILRTASSIAAEELLAQNYKLKVGETGVVGNVALTGQAYIAQDVDLDAIHHSNPFLPNTRSEIALPLRSYNVTIGVLDIQADTSGAFLDRDIQTLQVLADQLASAIENSILVQRLEDTLRELSRTNQEKTRQIWQSTASQNISAAYEYDGLQIRPMPQDLSPELSARLADGNPVEIKNGTKNTLLVPLLILRQLIGVIGLEQNDSEKRWSEDQIAIAQAAANRAALTLENARLFDESTRRATKENAIFTATSRISSTSSIENILKTTAEELDKVLNASEITIQFTNETSEGT